MYEVLDKVKIVAEDEIRYGCITNIKDDTYTVYVETEKKFYDIPGRMILEKTAVVQKKMSWSQKLATSIYTKKYAKIGAIFIVSVMFMIAAVFLIKSLA